MINAQRLYKSGILQRSVLQKVFTLHGFCRLYYKSWNAHRDGVLMVGEGFENQYGLGLQWLSKVAQARSSLTSYLSGLPCTSNIDHI